MELQIVKTQLTRSLYMQTNLPSVKLLLVGELV